MTYRYQIVDDLGEQLRLLKALGVSEPANFAADGPDHLFLSVSADGEEIGVIRGRFHEENERFQILMLLVSPGRRSAALLGELIAALLARADARFHPKEFYWLYDLRPGESDPFFRLVRQIPGVTARAEPSFCRFRVHLPGFRTRAERYSVSYAEKKGYRILHSRDVSPEAKEALMDMVRGADEGDGLRTLHPFVEEFDEDASLFLVEQESGALCSWVVCRLMAPGTLDVRRWYTLPGRREKLAGVYLMGVWIDLVCARYTDIEFLVRVGNEDMLHFGRWYFGAALQELYTEHTLRIEGF